MTTPPMVSLKFNIVPVAVVLGVQPLTRAIAAAPHRSAHDIVGPVDIDQTAKAHQVAARGRQWMVSATIAALGVDAP